MFQRRPSNDMAGEVKDYIDVLDKIKPSLGVCRTWTTMIMGV